MSTPHIGACQNAVHANANVHPPGALVHRPAWRRLVFAGCWLVGRLVLALTCRIRIEGEVPKGAAILVSNHPNYLDGPLALFISSRVRAIAKPSPYAPVRAVFSLIDAFVTRKGAASNSRLHLRAGGLLWIVPEGRLSPGPMGRARRGAAQFAAETGVPVVPTAMIGTAGLRLREWRPWRRPRVRIVIGKPRYVLPGEDLLEVAHEFMRELSRMTGTPYQAG